MEEIRCLLWLLMVFGTASPKIWTVLHHWKTPQKACEALRDSSGASQQGLPSHVVRRMHQIHAAQVDEVLARCEKQKISILWYGEPEYPEELFAIVNPPVLLFYRGGSLRAARDALSNGGGNPPSVGVQPQRCVEAVPGSGAAGLCDGHGICRRH